MSRNELVVCERPGCDIAFSKKTHNQKYHDDECCKQATNMRIMEKYYDGQARKKGATRYCRKCQVTRLSRYNEDTICSACSAQGSVERNNSVLNMLSNATLIA